MSLFTKERKLSEGLISRDIFFHSCWNLLKAKRPDLRDAMDSIESYISGYDSVELGCVDAKPEEEGEVKDEHRTRIL